MSSKTTRYALLVLASAAAVYWLSRKASDAVAAVGEAVNPLSSNNLANRAVTATGAALSGDEYWTLGGWFYDITHPTYDPNANLPAPAEPVSWQEMATRYGGK